jgi:tetratricopeptide (TPR) repeat protein
MFRHPTLVAILLFLISDAGHAKSASEVYEQAAKSTVVVENIDAKGKAQSMGSGVVLPDGNVVTNCHVVKDASRLKVRSGDKEHSATLRYSDWDRDVCSLSITGLSAPAVVVGSTKTLKVGAKVYAIGAPKGLSLTLSDGIVSSLRPVDGGHYIQTTAAISPGSSGGGLFDENGALVGLTTFYLAEGQNLNFAVPVEWVNELALRSTKASTEAQASQWQHKAFELEDRKDWPALIEHVRLWTKAQPNDAWAWRNLGSAYMYAGQPAKAIDAYQQAASIQPDSASVWHLLGILYDRTDQSAKAIQAYQQLLRISQDSVFAWHSLGNAYIKINQSDKAIEAYQQVLRFNPKDDSAWYNLGYAYYKAGQAAKAIEAYQQVLRFKPRNAPAWYNLGLAYAQSGQRGKMLEVYQRLKTLDAAIAEQFFKKVVMP